MATTRLASIRYLFRLGILLVQSGLHIRAEDCNAAEHVTTLSVDHVNSTSFRLSWSDSLSCADHYSVSWCVVPHPWIRHCVPETRNVSTNETSFVVGDLRPCSCYWVQVSAVRQAGLTSRAEQLVITSPVAGEVVDLAVAHLGERRYAAVWDVEGDDACVGSYRVCWRAEDEDEETCDRSSLSSYDLGGATLRACTNYTLSVASLSVGGQASRNVTASFLTGPDNVGDLNVSHVASHSALISWKQSPSSCAESYVLSWCQADRPSGICSPVSTVSLIPSASEYEITTLEPCVYNIITISTEAPDGTTSASSKVAVDTKSDAFGPLTDVQATPANSRAFTLSYGPPANATYCLAGVVGCYQEAGTAGEPACYKAIAPGFWTSGEPATKACTGYEVTLTAISKDNATATTTLSYTSPPDPVENLKLTNSSAGPGGSSVAVTWESSTDNRCATHQHIRYSSFDEDLWAHDVNLTKDTTKYVVTDMTPCTEYVLEVVVEPCSAFSNTTSVNFFTASNVTSASEVKVVTTDEHSIKVSYQAPEASPRCVSGYSFCWHQTSSGGDTCRFSNASGLTEVTIEGLSNCTSYNVSVVPVAPSSDKYTFTNITVTTTGCTAATGKSAVSRVEAAAYALLLCVLLFHALAAHWL